MPKSKGCKIKLIENKAAIASKTAPVIMLDLFDVFIVPLSAVENGCLGKFFTAVMVKARLDIFRDRMKKIIHSFAVLLEEAVLMMQQHRKHLENKQKLR